MHTEQSIVARSEGNSRLITSSAEQSAAWVCACDAFGTVPTRPRAQPKASHCSGCRVSRSLPGFSPPSHTSTGPPCGGRPCSCRSPSWTRWTSRLCVALAREDGEPEVCRLYDTRGEAQHGIDLYARLRNGRCYATYPCKRYEKVIHSVLDQSQIDRVKEFEPVDRRHQRSRDDRGDDGAAALKFGKEEQSMQRVRTSPVVMPFGPDHQRSNKVASSRLAASAPRR